MLGRQVPTRWALAAIALAIGAALAAVFVVGRRHAEHRQALPPSILRSLITEQSTFRERAADLRYATSLDALGGHWSTELYTDYNGYTYELLPPPGDPTLTWAARAFPVTNAEWSHYYVDHTGVIRCETGRPAGPESPAWVPPRR